MSRLVFDGNYKVYYSPAAIVGAPSVADIPDWVDITAAVPKDGFNPGVSNSRVTGGSLEDGFMDESMGTYSSQLAITIYKDTAVGGGEAFETIGVRGETGAIIAVPNAPAVVGADAYVWPDVEFGEVVPMGSAENTRQKAVVDVAVRQAPDFHATFVA